MSKHGGSPESGLIQPIGIEALRAPDGGLIVEPEVVVKQREEAAKRRERALQLERRRLALEVLPALMTFGMAAEREDKVGAALGYADELIKQTGGDV